MQFYNQWVVAKSLQFERHVDSLVKVRQLSCLIIIIIASLEAILIDE